MAKEVLVSQFRTKIARFRTSASLKASARQTVSQKRTSGGFSHKELKDHKKGNWGRVQTLNFCHTKGAKDTKEEAKINRPPSLGSSGAASRMDADRKWKFNAKTPSRAKTQREVRNR